MTRVTARVPAAPYSDSRRGGSKLAPLETGGSNDHIYDHLHTINETERDNAATQFGYVKEGTACFVFPDAVSGGTGSVPFYRLVGSPVGKPNHLYTADLTEFNNAIAKYHYQYEGFPACWVFIQRLPNTVPLFRFTNATNFDHVYTISDSEFSELKNNPGFTLDGIACYVYASQAPGTVELYRLRLEAQ